MNIIKTTTENKVDLVRATNTTNTIQNIDSDKVLNLKDVIIYSTTDDNGDEVEVTALKVEVDNELIFVNSISKTVKQSVETILSVFAEDEIKGGIPIRVLSDTSKGGRTFYHIDLVESWVNRIIIL